MQNFTLVSATLPVVCLALMLLSGCAEDGETAHYLPRGGGAYSSSWGRVSQEKEDAKRRGVDRLADARYDYRRVQPVVAPLPGGGYQVTLANQSTVTFDASGTGTGSADATDDDLRNAVYAVQEYKQRHLIGTLGPSSPVSVERR